MKLSFLLSFVAIMSISAGTYSQSVRFNLCMKGVTIESVLETISKQSEFKLVYDNSRDELKKYVNIVAKNKQLEQILDEILSNTGVKYQVIDKYIVITSKNPVKEPIPVEAQQQIKVSGTITDINDNPLPGVSVMVKNTTRGVVSDLNGKYTINVDSRNDILVFSFIGFVTEMAPVKTQNVIDVKLSEDVQKLEEVVVVGFGSQKKVSVTGAISNIATKDLVQSPVANITNSLVGRLPGLTAVQRSGEPGQEGSTIKIRGIGTLSDGDPSSPIIVVDGVERDNINLLDPNEIETISILKDASATAVYGIRGANGVIIVTTKTGTEGKPKFSFSANYALQNVTKTPDLVGAYDWAKLKNEALLNDGKPIMFSDDDLQKFKDHSNPIFYPDINWFDKILKPYTGQQQYNLNISGGTKTTKYFVSLGYFKQDGMYRYGDYNSDYNTNPSYKRYNLRSNFDFNITKRLVTYIKLSAQIADMNYPGKSASDIFYSVLCANPISSPGLIGDKIISGYVIDPIKVSIARGSNPLTSILTNGYAQNYNSRVNLNVGFKYDLDFITRGLLFRGMTTYDSYYAHNVSRGKNVDQYGIYQDPNDATKPIYIRTTTDQPLGFSESSDKDRVIYSEAALEYNRTFSKHTVTGLLLYNQRKHYNPGLAYNVPEAMLGAVGRVTYNYSNRYLAEFDMGYNGSEQFAEGKRFGFFPAFSLGWVATEEPFFPKNDWVSFLKVRGSYGEVGNDKLGGTRFLYLPNSFSYTGTAGGGYYFGTYGVDRQAYNGSAEGKIGNPDVTWERAKKWNIGYEIKFLHDRLSFTSDFFGEKRNNILITLQSPTALVGATLPAANKGKVENHGFEFDGSWRDKIGKINYWFKANYSFARNKVIEKDEPQKQYPWMMETGYSVSQFKGLIFDGYFNTVDELSNRPTSAWSDAQIKLGDMRYKDINGDGIIDSKDAVPIGYANFPEITYGVSFGGDYKGFDFSILFQGVAHVSCNLSETAAWPFDQNTRQAQTWHLERWTPERYAAGEKISFPRVSEGGVIANDKQLSTFWLQDASYLRLKNAEVGYRFKGSVLKKVGIESLRIYMNGNNLITWTKMKTYDPEAPSGRGQFYPQIRTFNAGLNLTF
ncbi:MAG: TonB-dependent receptor [Bacteroidota bacterium]|nr:TonB-dependent receptor [Bacteroidota bacterium]